MKIIGIAGPKVDVDASIGVLSALADSCGLSIHRMGTDDDYPVGGNIVLGELHASPAHRHHLRQQPSIHVVLSDVISPDATVRFESGPCSPAPFRGRMITTGAVVSDKPREFSGEVLATCNGKPLWITSQEYGVRHDTCWVMCPWIKLGDCVFDHLNGKRFMNLLPLLEWMRSVSNWQEWQQPPLRACFMFDDPNFHACSYGFVDYAHLAAEGRRHHYHSSFATVPLDSYYVSPAAARIVREHGDTLSFLVHGNNHTYRELADRTAAPAHRLAQMQQAISRISRLEEKARVPVSRVMAPPHGVCSSEMMSAMVGAGFEAVCVSHGSVWTGNPGAKWATSLGALPAMVISGLPVIPRFGLDRKSENQILLAIYLNQPIIPVGHHWDLAEGTDILSSIAEFINGSGEVHWSDMTMIARSNYRYKIEGQVMRVHPFSRLIRLTVPENVTELVMESTWWDPALDRIDARKSGDSEALPLIANATGSTVQVTTRAVVELATVRQLSAEVRRNPPKTPVRVIGRKMLVELRDRTMPFLPRIAQRR